MVNNETINIGYIGMLETYGKGKGVEEAVKTFQNLMGSDVEARRSFIEKRAKEVVNLDV